MPPLALITLPLPLNGPPPAYGWNDREMSTTSSLTAFRTGLEGRDRFLGEIRCVVCGAETVEHCYVIMPSDRDVWTDLRRRRWVPAKSKHEPAHEPRNGLILCPTHHTEFDQYQFFIRYDPQARVFVLINYSGRRGLALFHGKAIAIDIDDQHAPFPSIFIVHEMRVRGHNPFQPIEPGLPNDIKWQDWIITDDLLHHFPIPANKLFKRDPPSDDDDENGGGDDGDGEGNDNGSGDNGGAGGDDANNNDSDGRNLPWRSGRARYTRQQGMMAGTSSGTRKLELNAGVIADILAATHAMPSWKACQIENTSWSGTTDENIQRCVSSIGVEEELSVNAAEPTGAFL